MLRRYWMTNIPCDLNRIEIRDENFHHIFDVCRNQVGCEFELLGIKPGFAIKVVVTDLEKKRAFTMALSERAIPSLPNPRIVLNLSIPKITTLEAIVEKSVELGVDRVQLFTSQYSFHKSAQDFSSTRMDRLRKIALHASQQSDRGELMQILEPKSWDIILNSFANHSPSLTGLLAYEGSSSTVSLKSKLSQLVLAGQPEVWVFVGSEGGYSPTEVAQAQDVGLEIIRLGSQVLKVETACVVLVGSLKYELGLI